MVKKKSKRGWVSKEYGRGTRANKCFKCGQEGHLAVLLIWSKTEGACRESERPQH